MVANKQDAEDLVQDTYIKAVSNLSTYQGKKASLKTWVYTIALNNAKNRLSKMKRWGENDLTICENYHSSSPELMAEIGQVFSSSPDARFEMKEHLDYCFTCITKTLELTQQICLLLKDVYGFKQEDFFQMVRNFELIRYVSNENLLVTEVELTVATPSGKEIILEMAEFYEIKDEKIHSVKVHYDATEFRNEFGMGA